MPSFLLLTAASGNRGLEGRYNTVLPGFSTPSRRFLRLQPSPPPLGLRLDWVGFTLLGGLGMSSSAELDRLWRYRADRAEDVVIRAAHGPEALGLTA